MHIARVALLASALLLAVSVISAADPCVLPANQGRAWVGNPETLKACFTQVPFQKDQAIKTLDAMDSLADLYSFTDIAVNSGAPYNIKVDLRGTLASIRSKANAGSYSNDYAFQTDIMNLMNPLFDAHTLYRAPGGYQCFFLRPFNIEAAVVSGQMQYTLRLGPLGDAGNNIWQSTFGFNPSTLVDKVVSSINGKSVTDHVDMVARNFVSTYKDQGVRFNAALRGRWAQSVLSMFPLTDSNFDFVSTYKMADGSTVQVPNAAFCNPGIDSTSALLQRNKGGGLLKKAEETTVDPLVLVRGIDVHQEQERMFQEAVAALPAHMLRKNREVAERMSREVPAPRFDQSVRIQDLTQVHAALGPEFNDLTHFNIPTRHLPANFDASHLKLVSASRANDTYYMKYNDGRNPPIWIYKLMSFAPADVAETLNILNTLLRDAQSNQGVHLIADVAYNGGGIICLSDLILALLVPEWESLQPGVRKPDSTTPYGIYDYKASKTALAIRSNSNLNSLFTSYTNYLDRKTEKPVTTAFYDDIARTRAGTTSNYTQQALFPAQCVGYPRTSFTPVKYYFKSITVLTDGTCGSACALFASQLQSNKLAKVVSYGGPLGRTEPLSTASFAGGNVLEYGTVATYSYLYGGSTPGLPPRMSSSALARFNFNEYYEDNDLNTPREFLKRPADHHIDFYATMFANNPLTPAGLANNAALYAAVAQTF